MCVFVCLCVLLINVLLAAAVPVDCCAFAVAFSISKVCMYVISLDTYMSKYSLCIATFHAPHIDRVCRFANRLF